MEGRFISKDPAGFKGGINLYAYAMNNPITNKDPFGLFTMSGSCCGKEKGISNQISNACKTKLAMITDPQLRACIAKRCNDATVECENDCAPRLLGYNRSFLGFHSSTIHICANNCNGFDAGLIAIHEWAHSCGWDHGGGQGVPGGGGTY